MKFKVMFRNSSVVKMYIIRPKPGPVAKNATPRPSLLYILYGMLQPSRVKILIH